MWIEKSKTKYRACAYYVDPLTLTRHKVGVTISKDTAQQRNIAKQKLDSLIMEKTNCLPTVITLDHLVSEYRSFQKTAVKESTYRRNYHVCNAFLNAIGGQSDVNRLTARTIKRKLLAYNPDPTTYNEYVGRFKALIRWGYRNDMVKDIAWLDKIERLKNRTEKQKVADKFLERSECDALLSSMNHEEWKYLTQLLILSGIRVGEAFALNRSDLDIKARYITVSKTLDPNSRVITTPKTISSYRAVYMQDDLHALCASLRRFATQKARRLGLDTPLLFFDLTGGYGEYYAYRKYLAESSTRAIGRAVTPHVLRHTHASLLAEQGLPLDLISRRLGHENSRITRDIYVHVTEQRKKQDNALLKSISLF